MIIEFVFRIFISALLGGIIGLEREYRAKEAGFRTHFLVALGSGLFMIISQYGFDIDSDTLRNVSLDPSRIASQVVTGIGFIGAGTIIFQKHMIRGLTTAAGLWVTSAIGLACGAGMYVLAAATTALVLMGLEALNFILHRWGTRNISVTFTSNRRESIKEVINRLKGEGVEISYYNMTERHTGNENLFITSMEVKVKRDQYETKIIDFMNKLDCVDIESIE